MGAYRNGGVVGKGGHQPSGIVDDAIQLTGALGEQIVELADLSCGAIVTLHQAVHVESVALLRGDSSCRGVGLHKIAHLCELCQLVTNGRRGKSDLPFCCQQF